MLQTLPFFGILALWALPAVSEEASGPVGEPWAGRAGFAEHCMQCHDISPEAAHLVGPALSGVVARGVAATPDYDYSDAFVALRGAGVWDSDRLHRFLTNPTTDIPGTSMHFDGLPDAGQRADLIAYLAAAPDLPPPVMSMSRVPDAVLAMQGDVAYGEYLSSECVGCHQLSGQTGGVPSITGWPTGPFIVAMFDYRAKDRDNVTMQTLAARLSDEEIAALAAYFETVR